MSVEVKEWFRPASSGWGRIFSRRWVDGAPRALLVIAHGMAEHSGRYGHFARFLYGAPPRRPSGATPACRCC